MKKAIRDEWRKLRRSYRAEGENQGRNTGAALWTLKSARWAAEVNEAWDEAGDSVRFRVEWYQYIDIEDLLGDTYTPELHPDIPYAQIMRERKAEIERIEREGTAYIAADYYDPLRREWILADSCGGFVGNEWEDSGDDLYIKMSAVHALRESEIQELIA
jgi:hypothetical protein